MALDPDDLIIFKVREEESEKNIKKKKGEKKQPENASKVDVPQKQTEIPKKEVEIPAVKKEEIQPHEEHYEEYKEKQQAQLSTPKYAEKNIEEIPKNEIIFYTVTPTEAAEEMVTGPNLENKIVEIKNELGKKSLSAKESKRIGKHLACTWHPWRQAYAICDYCRRPFCYEDLVEHNGLYYCLEDIDKVSNIKETELIKYNNFRILSSTMLFFVFFIFLYFNYNSIITIPAQLQRVGLNAFFENIFTPLGYMIAKTTLILLSLIISFAITADFKKSFAMLSIVGTLTALLFGYLYIETNIFYYIIIAILSLASIILLAYSRASYNTLPAPSEEDLASEVLNATKTTF
jgi:hypothetical protein